MNDLKSPKPALVLILFLAISVGGGLLIGSVSRPDGWFAALVKPSFQPPNWLFAPVWTVLYVLIGIAGARIYRIAPKSAVMRIWFAQMLFNFLWSPIFFVAHELALALIVILMLLASIIAFMLKARSVDRTAAMLFIPYALWVCFASLLNASLIALN